MKTTVQRCRQGLQANKRMQHLYLSCLPQDTLEDFHYYGLMKKEGKPRTYDMLEIKNHHS